MVIHFHCFQDYFNLLYHPETIKSDSMRRPSWSSTFVVFKTILVSFTIQRQSSLMACGHHHGHPLSLFSIETITVSFTIWIQSSSIACRDHHGYPLSLFSRLFQPPLTSKVMQSYPARVLDRRLQVDWARDAREGPRVLMSLRVDFGPMG